MSKLNLKKIIREEIQKELREDNLSGISHYIPTDKTEVLGKDKNGKNIYLGSQVIVTDTQGEKTKETVIAKEPKYGGIICNRSYTVSPKSVEVIS